MKPGPLYLILALWLLNVPHIIIAVYVLVCLVSLITEDVVRRRRR